MSALNTHLPLRGVKILDLTRVLAGPFATMILGDYGAEIIKVEKPGQGDETRNWGPPFVEDQSVYFLSINRNKRSIAIDMSRPEGQTIIRQLAKKSDILIESYLPGQLRKFGLDYHSMQDVNEKLIYCSITGFGSSGPYSQRPGYDLIAQAVGGMMSITGSKEAGPAKVGVAIVDLATGLSAVGAISAALYQREKTQQGTKIECSLIETQLSLLFHIAANYLNTGMEAEHHGTAHATIVPYQAFVCKDGKRLVVAAANDRFFRELCFIIDLVHLADDELYKTNNRRVTNRETLISTLSEKFKEKTLSEWLALFEKSTKMPFGPINNMQEVFNDEHVKSLNQVLEIKNSIRNEMIRIVGPSANFDNVTKESMVRFAPPILGQHTREILKSELNYNDCRIVDLSRQNVVQCGE